jgi:hypothetical protein
VQVPGHDPLELALLGRRAELEARLVARADHAEHLRVGARQMGDGDRARGGRARAVR